MLQCCDADGCCQNAAKMAEADISSSSVQPLSASEGCELPDAENTVPSLQPIAASLLETPEFCQLTAVSKQLEELMNGLAASGGNAATSEHQDSVQNLPAADVSAETLFPRIINRLLEVANRAMLLNGSTAEQPTSGSDSGRSGSNDLQPDVSQDAITDNVDGDVLQQHASSDKAAAASLNGNCQQTDGLVNSVLMPSSTSVPPSIGVVASHAPEFVAQGNFM